MYRLKILIGALLVSMLALGGVVTQPPLPRQMSPLLLRKAFLSRLLLQFQAGTLPSEIMRNLAAI